MSDLLIFDEEQWLIRGDWVAVYRTDELVRLGCDYESAKELAREMLNDARRQYYSLKKFRRFYFIDDLDVDDLLLEHPHFAPGCRRVGRKR